MPANERPSRSRSKVRDLPVGARFIYNGEVFKLDRNEPGYVDGRSEQFSNIVAFYDPITARKSGGLSWDLAVEVLAS